MIFSEEFSFMTRRLPCKPSLLQQTVGSELLLKDLRCTFLISFASLSAHFLPTNKGEPAMFYV
jgi:hypothetical protein